MNRDDQHVLRARCAQILLGAVLVALAGACGTGHILARDETPLLEAGDGFMAMAVETNKLLSVTLCRDSDLTHCVAFGGLSASHQLVVSVAPAGRYCLTTLQAADPGGGMAYTWNFEPGNTTCFEVTAERISYPGHFVVNDAKGGGVGWDGERSVTATLRAAYPKLARWPVQKVTILHR